jgi:hypothetical protein
MENTYGNQVKNLEDHFKWLKQHCGINKMGVKRFKQLKTAFAPSVGELEELLDALVENISR